MSFPRDVRETALTNSRRYCCICHEFAGRDAVVHHIHPESDGGPNILDNAIVLCSRCHSEAGHYNPRHPLGTKYAPSELRRHRDEWWKYCENYDSQIRPEMEEVHPLDTIPNGQDIRLVEKEIGTIWSRLLNEPAQSQIVRFEGKFIAEVNMENVNGPKGYELYQLKNGQYVVYSAYVYRNDFCKANLAGVNAWGEFDPPLTLRRLQEEYPILAKAAGLVLVQDFKVD